MADDDKEAPKVLRLDTRTEVDLWVRVYIQAIHSNYGVPEVVADTAVEKLRERSGPYEL